MTGEPRPTGDDKWPAAAEKDLQRVRELGRGNFGAVWLCKSKKAAEGKKIDGDATSGYVAVKVRLHLFVRGGCPLIRLFTYTTKLHALICLPFVYCKFRLHCISPLSARTRLRSLTSCSPHSTHYAPFYLRTLTYPSHRSRHMRREKSPCYPKWTTRM